MAKTIERFLIVIPSSKAAVNVEYSIADGDLGKTGALTLDYTGTETVDEMMVRAVAAIKTEEGIS